MLNPKPVIILVHPQMGENIGAAARAMGNFGLSELRIVAPRDGWPNQQAYAMAAHATPILDAAKVYPNTEEAVADLARVYATCCRMRDMQKPVTTPRKMIAEAKPERWGVLFGPERTGLENPDIVRADSLVFIPVSEEYPSLNLAQAIAVIAYEHFSATATPTLPELEPEAPQIELEGLLGHIEAELDAVNFYQVPHKKAKMDQNIRNMFTRARLSSQEIRTLRGMLKAIARKKD